MHAAREWYKATKALYTSEANSHIIRRLLCIDFSFTIY